MTNSTSQSGKSKKGEANRRWFYWIYQDEPVLGILAILMMVGLLLLTAMASGSEMSHQFLPTLGISALVSGAFAMLGGLLGFIFGIPRTKVSDGDAAGGTDGKTEFEHNTNLEDISDWLTKILVGVGLTQLTLFPASLWSLAEKIGPGLGDGEYFVVLALAAVLFYFIAGFLYSYLWTRLYLKGALKRADLRAEMQDIAEKAYQVESTADANAVKAVRLQLNPMGDYSPPTTEEMKALVAAIAAASPYARETILNDAWRLRRASWERDSGRMERTIPVFKALIDGDPVPNHKYHGNLGWALKDKLPPDWLNAEKHLTTAIELRNKAEEPGWLFYEANRAICRIKIETENEGSFTDEQIFEDLDVAGKIKDFANEFSNVSTITDWLGSKGDLNLDSFPRNPASPGNGD